MSHRRHIEVGSPNPLSSVCNGQLIPVSRAPLLSPDRRKLLKQFGTYGSGLFLSSLAGSAFTSVVSSRWREADFIQATAEAVDPDGFRDAMIKNSVEDAIAICTKAMVNARKIANRREELMWHYNLELAVAVSSPSPQAIVLITSVLSDAWRDLPRRGPYWRWLLGATFDLIYLNIVFMRRHPEDAEEELELEGVRHLNAGVHIKKSELPKGAFLWHVFELSPALTIGDSPAPQLFLRAKIAAMKSKSREADHGECKRLLDECHDLKLHNNDGGLAIVLARVMNLDSLGQCEKAKALVKATTPMISSIVDKTNQTHLWTIPAIYSDKPNELRESLEAQKTTKRKFMGLLPAQDSATFYGGLPALDRRKKLAQAAVDSMSADSELPCVRNSLLASAA